MKPNIAAKDVWLLAQTANENLKQDTLTTQDADGMQAIPQQYCVSLEGAPSPWPPTFLLRFQSRDMQHFKTNTLEMSCHSHPMKFFFIFLHFTCAQKCLQC